MEQPVLCPQRLNLLHREGWSPAHSPVVCPYTFYIIAVAVAIGRELTNPTNVANLHAVVVQTCGNHHFRMCRVSFPHVAVQQCQGTVGIAADRVEAFHAFLQRISAVVAPVPPWPLPVVLSKPLYVAAQEVVAAKDAVAVFHQRAPSAREHHIVLNEPVMAVVRVVEEETQRDEVRAAWNQRVLNRGIAQGSQVFGNIMPYIDIIR